MLANSELVMMEVLENKLSTSLSLTSERYSKVFSVMSTVHAMPEW